MREFIGGFGPALKEQHWSFACVAILVALSSGMLYVTGTLTISKVCVYLVFGAAYFILLMAIAVFVGLLFSAGFRAMKIAR